MSLGQPRVGIAICSTGSIPGDFLQSYISLLKSPYVVEYAHTAGSLLPMARNESVGKLNLDELTHVLILDTDMCDFSDLHLAKLLKDGKNVVTGICVLRQPPHRVAVKAYDKKDITDQLNRAINGEPTELVPVEYTGTAFLLVTVGALRAVQQPGGIFFDTDRRQRDNFPYEADRAVEEFLQEDFSTKEDMISDLYNLIFLGLNAHWGTDLIGEDVSFSLRLKDKGYKIYLDPSVHVAHIGQRKFTIADTIRSTRMAKQTQTKAGNSIPSNKAVGNKEATRGTKPDVKPQKGPSAKTTMKHQNA